MAGPPGERVVVGNTSVRGIHVDAETRCAHYGSDRDVVAIAFACCGTFYPCFRCHEALADHETTRWSPPARDVRAVLCGACGTRLTIATYFRALGRNAACPSCGAGFNPGCVEHLDRYFEP